MTRRLSSLPTLTGAVVRTLVRGTDVWIDGEVTGEPGHGKHASPTMER